MIGLAPKAKLRVYEAPGSNYAKSTIDEYTRIISDNKAQILSSSYGLCESIVNGLDPGLAASENTLFQEAATQGISTFVAVGRHRIQRVLPEWRRRRFEPGLG